MMTASQSSAIPPDQALVLIHAIASADDGVAIVDAAGVIIYANSAHAALFGHGEPAEQIGRSWQTLYSGAPAAAQLSEIVAHVAAGRSWRGELEATRAGGGSFREDLNVTPLAGGGFLRVARLMPVSPEPTAELQRKFLSKVSHDFRTPLATMQGVIYLLQKDLAVQPDEKRERWLGLLRDAVAKLRELADGVLDLNRSEGTSTPSLPIGNSSVRQLIASVIAATEGAMNRAIVEVAPEVPVQVATHEGLLRVALGHLLSNALKYSPADAPVRVVVTRRGSGVRFSVIDVGCGIPAADQPRLWDPFFRASNVGHTPGTGLGMLIVRRAADHLGATVGFVSCQDAGSTFWIELSP